MSASSVKWLWVLLPLFAAGFAQGDANLLMQYNKGPDLDGFYRKWNFDLHFHGVYGNSQLEYSIYKISYSAGVYIQYKFSKTLALNSGWDYFNLNYQYDLTRNQSHDQLSYLSMPLTLRVFPSRKLHFETGLLYNHLLTAQNSEIVDFRNQSTTYPQGRFKNAFGWLFAAQYNVWKKFSLSTQYRFYKKASDPLSDQTNDFKAFLIGVHYWILDPKKKPL
jgi:hypothetical protein